MDWKIRDRKISFEKTLLMGIVNVTPDSFSDGGLYLDPEKAFEQANRLYQEGADFLDLGAESTRPGAKEISEEEQLKRLLPVLEKILSELPVPVSIDTTQSGVALECLKRGAHIINDVSGLRDSGRPMAEAVKTFGAGLILMHRRGNPETMQQLTQYQDVTGEVLRELSQSLQMAEDFGVNAEQIVIDPGLGFSKTAEQNVEILQGLERFHCLQRPVLIGPSRKSFIGKITGRQPLDREFGTAAVCTFAVLKGIQILRVHEVGAMRDAALIAEAIKGESYVRA